MFRKLSANTTPRPDASVRGATYRPETALLVRAATDGYRGAPARRQTSRRQHISDSPQLELELE